VVECPWLVSVLFGGPGSRLGEAGACLTTWILGVAALSQRLESSARDSYHDDKTELETKIPCLF